MLAEELFIEKKLPSALSKQDVYALLVRIKNNDSVAREKLIKHNIKLVLSRVMSRFKHVPYDKKDLVSIGNIGLLKAVNTFDISKNIAFSSYAIRCIDNEILLFIRKIKNDKNISSFDDIINVDKDGNDLKWEDLLHDDTNIEEEYINEETFQQIKQFVEELSGRNKEIIMLYFGFYGKRYTQQKIAEKMNISRSYVSRILAQNIKILKNKFDNKIDVQDASSKENPKNKVTENKMTITSKNITSKNIPKTFKKTNQKNQNEDGKNNVSNNNSAKKDFIKIDRLDETEIQENSITNNEEALKMLTILSKIININELTLKETAVVYLKFGVINNKYFSTEEISNFLDIEKQEIITIIKKVLGIYKKQIAFIFDDLIQITTEELLITDKQKIRE